MSVRPASYPGRGAALGEQEDQVEVVEVEREARHEQRRDRDQQQRQRDQAEALEAAGPVDRGRFGQILGNALSAPLHTRNMYG